MATTTAKRPSPAQIDLLNRLARERGVTVQDIANEQFEADFDLNTLTGGRNGTASQLITALFAMPRLDGQGTTKGNPEAGLYRVKVNQDTSAVVRVRYSKSGNWYAQMAEVPREGSGRKTLSWEYIGRRVDLGSAVMMDEAEAGRFLSYCVRCGAELTVEESKARGMGPTCARKSG